MIDNIITNIAWSDWIPFNREGINRVNQVAGAYEFANDTTLLYIGQSNELNRRLMEHLNGNDSCINRATHFRVIASNDPEGTEKTLLDEYRNGHNGNSPPCNN